MTVPLNTATHLLNTANLMYIVGAVCTALTAAWVVWETRAVALGKHTKHFLLSEILGAASAFICVLGSAGAIHYGNVVSHLKDDDLAAYKLEANTQIAEADKDAANAQKAAGRADATAQRAVLDKAKILHDNLYLQKQVEDERTARLQIEQQLAPRTLSRQQQDALEALLNKFPPQSVQMVVYQGDPEAQLLEGQILWVFGQLHWKVSTIEPLSGSTKGILIEYAGSQEGQMEKIGEAFYAFFRSTRFYFSGPFPNMAPLQTEFGAYMYSRQPGNSASLRIVIGTKWNPR